MIIKGMVVGGHPKVGAQDRGLPEVASDRSAVELADHVLRHVAAAASGRMTPARLHQILPACSRIVWLIRLNKLVIAMFFFVISDFWFSSRWVAVVSQISSSRPARRPGSGWRPRSARALPAPPR